MGRGGRIIIYLFAGVSPFVYLSLWLGKDTAGAVEGTGLKGTWALFKSHFQPGGWRRRQAGPSGPGVVGSMGGRRARGVAASRP